MATREENILQIKFESDDNLSLDTLKLLTHSKNKNKWTDIKNKLLNDQQTITLIDAQTDRKIPIGYNNIIAIESEERMCNVHLISGKMMLLGMRLKKFEEINNYHKLIKINNGTIINLDYIENFTSSENARIKITMKNKAVYLVNRYYIKQFKEKLS